MSTEKTIEEMRNDPDFISLHDADGEEVFISKEEWRTNVLPQTLEKYWDNPDELYNLIAASLYDGLHADVQEAVVATKLRPHHLTVNSPILWRSSDRNSATGCCGALVVVVLELVVLTASSNCFILAGKL